MAKRTQSRRGTAAIEFGLMIPLLAAFLAAAVELGFAIYETMQVFNAVEAGAIYASKKGFDSAGISAAVTNATGITTLTATPAPAQYCGCPQSSGSIVTVACGSTCSNGTSPSQYATVSAAMPHTTIVPYLSLGLPSSVTAQTTVRLK